MALVNQLTLPPGASLEGVRQGRSKRILLTIIIGRQKRLICKLDDLFLFLLYSPLYCCQNDGFTPPPHTLPDSLASSPYSPLLLAPVFCWFLHVK
jgi:hypothetical protein